MKKNGMWEVPLETQKIKVVENNIMAHTIKPKLERYIHAALFSQAAASLLKKIKQVFLKACPGLAENLIKKYL